MILFRHDQRAVRQMQRSELRIRELRLNRIRHLLAESDLTLTEIAAQTGYSSKIALSAAFRASDGMSPGAYRKKTRRQSEQGKFLLE